MNRYYNSRFGRDAFELSAGEYYSTRDRVLIGTVLGSCVSVVLHDVRTRRGGLNHFMLPKEIIPSARLSRYNYGQFAIESLINDFVKNGSRRGDLRSKIFGGSQILDQGGPYTVGTNNVEFARDYLERENIPILGGDTGGELPRRLYLEPESFKVYMKKQRKREDVMKRLQRELRTYEKSLEELETKESPIILF